MCCLLLQEYPYIFTNLNSDVTWPPAPPPPQEVDDTPRHPVGVDHIQPHPAARGAAQESGADDTNTATQSGSGVSSAMMALLAVAMVAMVVVVAAVALGVYHMKINNKSVRYERHFDGEEASFVNPVFESKAYA